MAVKKASCLALSFRFWLRIVLPLPLFDTELLKPGMPNQ